MVRADNERVAAVRGASAGMLTPVRACLGFSTMDGAVCNDICSCHVAGWSQQGPKYFQTPWLL